MAALAPCLRKLAGQVDAKELRQAVAAYQGRGKDEAAANIAAVADKIAELDAQERRIVEAVRAAWEKDGGGGAEPNTAPESTPPASIEETPSERIQDEPGQVERLPESQAQHIEGTAKEPATVAAVTNALKKSDRNTSLNLASAKKLLLTEIALATKRAPSAQDVGAWDKINRRVDVFAPDAMDTIGYRIFNVPGDGKFRVLNTKETLERFRKNVEKSGGFSGKATPFKATAPGSAPSTIIRDMLDDGEAMAAYELAKTRGTPFRFGAGDETVAPTLYTDADDYEHLGVKFFVGRSWHIKEKRGDWRAIEARSALSLGQGVNANSALAAAKKQMDDAKKEGVLDSRIKGAKAVSQADLEKRWLAWAEKNDEDYTNRESIAREAQAKADKRNAEIEDRWGNLFPSDRVPWNEALGKMNSQAAIRVRLEDADERNRGDDFLALVRFAFPDSEIGKYAKELADQREDAGIGDGTEWFYLAPSRGDSFSHRYRRDATGGTSAMITNHEADEWHGVIRDDGRIVEQFDVTGIREARRRADELLDGYLKQQEKPAPAQGKEPELKVPEDYKQIGTSYLGGSVEKPLYGRFADGDRVRDSDTGYSGVIESYFTDQKNQQIVTKYRVKYDNGTGEAVRDGRLSAVEPKRTESSASVKTPDSLNPLTNPVLHGDTIRFSSGAEWQARQGYTGMGWSLVKDGKTHPKATNLDGQVALIRAIGEIDGSTQSAKRQDDEPTYFTTDEAAKRLDWRDLGQTDNVKTLRLMFQDQDGGWITVASIEKFLPKGKWEVDGERFEFLSEAKRKAREVGLTTLRQQGYIKQLASPATPVADSETPVREPQEALRSVGATQGTTEDAGEELTANRRNKLTRGLKWEDIADKDEALRVKETTKAKVYPRPDYGALISSGMRPQVAHIVKQVYDSIATAPQTRGSPTDAQLQDFIAGVNRVMDGTMAWATDAEKVGAFVERLAQKAAVMSKRTFAISDLGAKPSSQPMTVVYPDGWRGAADQLRLIGGNKVLGALQPDVDEMIDAMKAVEKGWPAKQEAWQRQGYQIISGDDVTPDYYEGKHGKDVAEYVVGSLRLKSGNRTLTLDQFTIDGAASIDDESVQKEMQRRLALMAGKRILLNKAHRIVSMHDTQDAAEEAARAATKREGKTTISEKGIKVEHAQRVGPVRRMEGENVTSEQLKDTFKFRGINFGNWLKGKGNEAERQLHLNHAYDSFMDLAEIIGVPPEAMSLNGMLGVAIGAQGTGGSKSAAAHFVPGVNEINLTREYGAGSLAHEWAHGLDHYFARMAGLTRATEPFLTEHTQWKQPEGVRPAVFEKFRAIVTAMNKRPVTEAEAKANVEASMERALSNVGAWLKSIRLDFETRKADLTKFDRLADRVRSGDFGDGKVSASRYVFLSPVLAEIRDLYKATTGRLYSLESMRKLQSNVDHLEYVTKKPADDASHVPQQVSTDYANEARKLDQQKGGKPYWNTNLEKFARAFDAFVSDSLEAKAAKNSYLSHAGRVDETTPQGTERTAINQAFSDLVQTIEAKTADEAGNVALGKATDAPMGGLNLFAARAAGRSKLDTLLWSMANRGATSRELLDAIAKDSESAGNRRIAALIRALGVNPRMEVGANEEALNIEGRDEYAGKFVAAYSEATDTVYLLKPGSTEADLLHELVHAATSRAINAGTKTAKQMQILFERVKKVAGFNAYGLRTVKEFVAEGLSNPEFQAALDKIPAQRGRIRTLWQWFKDIIRQALGGTPKDMSALDQVLDLSERLMEEDARTAGRVEDVRLGNARPSFWMNMDGIQRAIAAARREQSRANKFDLDAEIKSLSESGNADLSRIVANPEYWDAENEELTDAGLAAADAETERQARKNLRLPEIRELSDLDGADHRAQYEAMKYLLDSAGIDYTDSSTTSSGYINVFGLKVRFANHANTTRDVTTRDHIGDGTNPTLINVAPGESTFQEALQAIQDVMGGRVEDVTLGSIERPTVATSISDSTAELARHNNTFNWLRTRLGSQPGKADMSPPFRRVYEAVESYVQDAAGMAVRAQELMPNLVPIRDEWRDVFKTNASQADQRAVASALYAGTFWGGPSPRDGRVFTREELLTGHTEGKVELQAMERGPAAVFARRQSKIQGQEFEVVPHPTKAGKFAVVKKGADSSAMKGARLEFDPLTGQQADLYFQARAAIDATVTEIGKAAMWRASRAMTAFTREDMEGYSLEDAQQRILDVLDTRIDDLAAELELLDKDRINDMAADIADMDGDASEFRAQQEREAQRVQREIDAVEAVKTSVDEIGGDAQALIAHGYMPAMRFGEHTVTVMVPGKDGKPRTELFLGFEFRYQANQAAKDLQQRYAGTKGAQVIVGGIAKMGHTMYEGTSIDGMERLAAHIMVPNEGAETGVHPLSDDAVVQEWIANATATRSALRHHLHRRGIPGYSTDLERVLGRFLPSGARLASSTYHMTEAAEGWEAINKQDADVKDEAAKLIRHVTDPKEKAGIPKNLMFISFLAIEPVRFIVNRTQPITVGIPWFMQHTSGTHAAELLLSKEPTDDAYKAAKQRAKELGITAPQEMHLLMAMGRGNAMVSALPSRVQEQIPTWMRTGMHNLNLLAGAFQQISEQQNREQVFKAAWLLAKENPKLGDPFKFAKKANDGINFVYGQHAIPDWARPYLGQLAFTYTQWPIQFTELAIKMAKEGHWKALGMLLFMVWVLAGAEGEPFAENAEDLIDAIGQASGHATNTKAWLRDKITGVAGPLVAEAMLRGPMSVLTGIDWSGRFSLGKIVPGTRALVRGEQESRGRELARIIGPMGTLADNAIKATLDDMFGGNTERGLERIAPKGVQSIVKGIEMIQTGEYRDIKGRKITDVTPLEGAFKMLGGHPESVGAQRRVEREVQSTTNLFEIRRREIMEDMVNAMRKKDDKGMESAVEEVRDWNTKNPEMPMQIKRADVAKKAKDMGLTSEQRMLRRAPKSVRKGIAERLQDAKP